MTLPKFVAAALTGVVIAFGLDFFGVVDLGPLLDSVTSTEAPAE